MRPVTDEQIEVAWNAVNDAASFEDELSKLMDDFEQDQPAIVEFLSEGAAQWGEDASDLAFQGALVIWKSYGEAGRADVVDAAGLIGRFRLNSAWLKDMQGDVILLQKKLQEYSRFEQPDLMRYVSELVFESNEDGLELDPDEQVGLFLALKTIVDSFSSAAASGL